MKWKYSHYSTPKGYLMSISLLPFQVESEVTQNGATGQEGATHAGEQVPVCAVCRAVGLGHVIGLFYQLTVHLISQWPQIVAGLQDALDDGDRVWNYLHFLKWVKDLHSLILQASISLLFLHCRKKEREMICKKKMKEDEVKIQKASLHK